MANIWLLSWQQSVEVIPCLPNHSLLAPVAVQRFQRPGHPSPRAACTHGAAGRPLKNTVPSPFAKLPPVHRLGNEQPKLYVGKLSWAGRNELQGTERRVDARQLSSYNAQLLPSDVDPRAALAAQMAAIWCQQEQHYPIPDLTAAPEPAGPPPSVAGSSRAPLRGQQSRGSSERRGTASAQHDWGPYTAEQRDWWLGHQEELAVARARLAVPPPPAQRDVSAVDPPDTHEPLQAEYFRRPPPGSVQDGSEQHTATPPLQTPPPPGYPLPPPRTHHQPRPKLRSAGLSASVNAGNAEGEGTPLLLGDERPPQPPLPGPQLNLLEEPPLQPTGSVDHSYPTEGGISSLPIDTPTLQSPSSQPQPQPAMLQHPTADTQQPMTEGHQPTANSPQRTVYGQQPTLQLEPTSMSDTPPADGSSPFQQIQQLLTAAEQRLQERSPHIRQVKRRDRALAPTARSALPGHRAGVVFLNAPRRSRAANPAGQPPDSAVSSVSDEHPDAGTEGLGLAPASAPASVAEPAIGPARLGVAVQYPGGTDSAASAQEPSLLEEGAAPEPSAQSVSENSALVQPQSSMDWNGGEAPPTDALWSEAAQPLERQQLRPFPPFPPPPALQEATAPADALLNSQQLDLTLADRAGEPNGVDALNPEEGRVPEVAPAEVASGAGGFATARRAFLLESTLAPRSVLPSTPNLPPPSPPPTYTHIPPPCPAPFSISRYPCGCLHQGAGYLHAPSLLGRSSVVCRARAARSGPCCCTAFEYQSGIMEVIL